MKIFLNKKVLLFGLGSLGGGVATAKWLFKQGAKLRITDLKTKKELETSLIKLKNIKAQYILGRHRYQDIDWADYVIVNPGVSYKNEYIQYALNKGKILENDCSLFFDYAQGDIIAITGTRGKTTTTNWIFHLLKVLLKNNKKVFLAGNQPQKGLLKILSRIDHESVSVIELPSFQLEFYRLSLRQPKIAIITSIFRDHLDRYSSMNEYVKTKMKIFQNQSQRDYLILNYDNQWTDFILKGRPKSQVYFVSLKKLPQKFLGIFYFRRHIFIRDKAEVIDFGNFEEFELKYGQHNLTNLLFSILGCYLYFKLLGKKFPKISKKYIFQLEPPVYRQQIIYQNKRILIVNDSASTSPDATISALKRFINLNRNIILITGGTDKNLNFKELAKLIEKFILPQNLVLLNGSATNKLIKEFKKNNYFLESNNCQNLEECFLKSLETSKKYRKSIILFSPGAASFEKFKNEFDRGEKFNLLVKKFLSNKKMFKILLGRNY